MGLFKLFHKKRTTPRSYTRASKRIKPKIKMPTPPPTNNWASAFQNQQAAINQMLQAQVQAAYYGSAPHYSNFGTHHVSSASGSMFPWEDRSPQPIVKENDTKKLLTDILNDKLNKAVT